MKFVKLDTAQPGYAEARNKLILMGFRPTLNKAKTLAWSPAPDAHGLAAPLLVKEQAGIDGIAAEIMSDDWGNAPLSALRQFL